MNLFLDDIRTPEDFFGYETEKWEVVKTHQEFINFIKEHGLPDKISLDHDLDDSHYDVDWTKIYPKGKRNPTKIPSGMETVEWIIQNIPKMKIMVHSMNPIGKEYMNRRLAEW